MDKSKECRKGDHDSCTTMGCPCRCPRHNPAKRDQFLTVKAVKGGIKVVKKIKNR